MLKVRGAAVGGNGYVGKNPPDSVLFRTRALGKLSHV
jgi:hypothetical protein